MLARRYLRENPEIVKTAIKNRNMGDGKMVESLLQLDEEWRNIKSKCDNLRHERNTVSALIGNLKNEGKEEAALDAITKSSVIKTKLDKLEESAKKMEEKLQKELLELPNIPHESVPIGMDESDLSLIHI